MAVHQEENSSSRISIRYCRTYRLASLIIYPETLQRSEITQDSPLPEPEIQSLATVCITIDSEGEAAYSIHEGIHINQQFRAVQRITPETDPRIIALVNRTKAEYRESKTPQSNTGSVPQAPPKPREDLDDLINEMKGTT